MHSLAYIQTPNDSSKWFRSTGAHSQFAMAIHFQISRRINEVSWKAIRILSGNIHSDRVLRANNVERNYSSKQGMVIAEFFTTRQDIHGFEFCEKKKCEWKKIIFLLFGLFLCDRRSMAGSDFFKILFFFNFSVFYCFSCIK